MSKLIKAVRPSPDSKEPARAAGAMTAAGALVYILAMRYLGADPEVAFGLGMILGPIITAEATRLFAYAPATVAKLLAAARAGRGLYTTDELRKLENS